MRWYANELGFGEEEDLWGTAGLLHNIDFEQGAAARKISLTVVQRTA